MSFDYDSWKLMCPEDEQPPVPEDICPDCGGKLTDDIRNGGLCCDYCGYTEGV